VCVYVCVISSSDIYKLPEVLVCGKCYHTIIMNSISMKRRARHLDKNNEVCWRGTCNISREMKGLIVGPLFMA
jgi:hypothetical protein